TWVRRHGDRTRAGSAIGSYGWLDAGSGRSLARGDRMTGHAHAIGEALRRHSAVSDAELDQVFPEELRDRSHLHWTPVAVALRAAELLAPTPDVRVLDVGAGVGKLCLIGALVTGATWWGIEQDPSQVAAANHAAWALDIAHRTRFVPGDGSRLAWD